MATESVLYKETFVAAADLRTLQFMFVKMNGTANQIVAVAADTDEPIGVLQNTPNTGQAAEVVIIGRTKVKQNGSIAPGAIIGCVNGGKADAKAWGTDKTEFGVGRMYENGGADNAIGSAFINCILPSKLNLTA